MDLSRKNNHGSLEYRINAGSRTTVHASSKKARKVLGKIPSGIVTTLFAGTVVATEVSQQQNGGSLERYLSGPATASSITVGIARENAC